METIRIGDRVKCTDECYKYDPSHHVCYGEVVGEYFSDLSQKTVGWLVKRDDGYSAFSDIEGVCAHPYEGLWIALGTVEPLSEEENFWFGTQWTPEQIEEIKRYTPDVFDFSKIKRIRDTF